MTVTAAPLGITGSTGNLGGCVARRLAEAGVAQRLLVRDVTRAPEFSEARPITYADTPAVRESLAGLKTLFMVSGTESPTRVDEHCAFVDAAVASGVEHIVYVSFFGAAPDATFTHARDHWHTEQHLRSSGVAFTFLRDNLYADFLPGMAGDDGVMRGPAGEGRVAAVAQDDIAEVAVAVLRDPAGHAGRSWDLTGPEALTLGEVAATITEVTGRPVRFENETLAQARASRAGYGAPEWLVKAWISTYTAIAAGELATVSTAVEDITGHPAKSLAQLLREA
ncbi:NAD(P)-dependent oxidoreductase [Kineosporia sp. NBRC 101677]|uniref:SDR family oxidoreductase n=1 Tax=Kineosporia sp. NBRC 101677 TaxID=3032197 RepID=UPI0024A4C40C|nr:SDR family oxidoreductase [Kineosporia sp. NBRC 101677]GLY15944.1 NAD(P)-dependent oxidoreductase [Kineosporia sp. NBRC 101677]